MKCPQCGLVTFDDLPQCPRCKESFALVRPLASASLDGARHVLRDDPELRLKLRDRLHRARLDRRKQNENPMATGPDPDAPDWFEPELGGDNGAAEAMLAAVPATGERSEERAVVYTDDLSPDDDVRGGVTTDTDAEIIEASREVDDAEGPEFQGDIPGFTDWREELRERLKRIRARREQERLAAEDGADEDAMAEAEDTPDEDTQSDAELEAAAAEDEETAAELEAVAEEDEETSAELEAVTEEGAELEAVAEEDEEADAELEAVAEEDEETSAELEAVTEEGEETGAEEPTAEIIGFAAALHSVPNEETEGQTVAPPDLSIAEGPTTAGDIIARIVDGPADATIPDDDAPGEAPPQDTDAGAETALEDIEPEPDSMQASGDLDGDLDLAPEADSGVDIDFTLDTEAPVVAPDLDLSEGFAGDSPDALILGEKKAEPSVPDAEGVDDLMAEEASPLPGEDTSDEAATEPRETFGWGETADASDLEEADSAEAADATDIEEEEGSEATDTAPGDRELPAAIMPDLPAVNGAPELDFDDAPAALAAPPEIDLPAVEETDDQALEWDREEVAAGSTAASSAGPLGERAAAAVCDMLVLTAIGAALVGAASSGTGVPFRQVLAGETLSLGLAWSIFAIGYSVFFVGSCGQTIGRMVMRLRVVGDDQFSVGFDRAAIRLGAWILSALPLFAGLLPALRDPQRRTLHDRLSRTRVVKA